MTQPVLGLQEQDLPANLAPGWKDKWLRLPCEFWGVSIPGRLVPGDWPFFIGWSSRMLRIAYCSPLNIFKFLGQILLVLPGVPYLPGVLYLPRVPYLPGIHYLPGVPYLLELPYLLSVPYLPGSSTYPGVPYLPGIPHLHLRWLEIVFEIFATRKRFTFIYIIAAFNVATWLSNDCTFSSHFIFDTLKSSNVTMVT